MSGLAMRLTVGEIAQLARRHPQHVYAALRSGALSGSQSKKGGTWTADPDDVQVWLDGGSPQVRSDPAPTPRR